MTEVLTKTLRSTRSRLTGVKAIMLAGTDGRPLAQSVDDHDVDSVAATAAVAASSLQLGRRLGDLNGDGSLEEITVRSEDGYVIVNAVGDRWVLCALTVRSANVAMLNLAFRDLIPELENHLNR